MPYLKGSKLREFEADSEVAKPKFGGIFPLKS